MHDYSINKHPKEQVLFFLTFISIYIAPYLNSIIQNIQSLAGSHSLSTAVPLFALFSFLYWIFNQYLWKFNLLRKILLVPDLNGQWNIEGSTIMKNGQEVDYKWNGILTITQSWSKILIYLQSSKSASKSVAASLYHEEGIGYKLLYQYENAPLANEVELQKHSGTVELLFDLECSSAEGYYYTDQYRKTVGTIKITKA